MSQKKLEFIDSYSLFMFDSSKNVLSLKKQVGYHFFNQFFLNKGTHLNLIINAKLIRKMSLEKT